MTYTIKDFVNEFGNFAKETKIRQLLKDNNFEPDRSQHAFRFGDNAHAFLIEYFKNEEKYSKIKTSLMNDDQVNNELIKSNQEVAKNVRQLNDTLTMIVSLLQGMDTQSLPLKAENTMVSSDMTKYVGEKDLLITFSIVLVVVCFLIMIPVGFGLGFF